MSDPIRLQRALSYEFADSDLLSLALAHRSVGKNNNERLEFLGDSIVNHIVAEALYRKFPLANEGEMSRMRAALVKGDTLAEVATEIELGEYLKLGPGERKSGGYRRSSILADALEAVIGAILLDSDVDRCREVVLPLFSSRLDQLNQSPTQKDAKTALQEFLQGRHLPLPEYEVLTTDGADHELAFRVNCVLKKPALTITGEGGSRRKAEQAAALLALKRINTNGK